PPPLARVQESYRATEVPEAPPAPLAAPAPARRKGGRGWLMFAVIAFIVVLLLMAAVDGLFSGVDPAAAPTGPSEPSAAAGREEQPSLAPAPTEQLAAAPAPTEAEARAQPTVEGLPEAQTITLDDRITAEITSPGQQFAYSFEAAPGQQVFVWTAEFDSEMRQIKLRLLDSLGDEIESTCLGCGNIGVVTLKKGGSYTLVVGSDSSEATGAFELRVSLVPPTTTFNIPIDMRIVSGEPGAGAGEIDLPGAKDAYTFDATPGQQVFVWTAEFDSEMRQIKLHLLDSLGDEVESTCLGCGNMGAVELKKGGSYTLLVGSDTEPVTGAYEIRLNAIPPPATFDVSLPVTIAADAPAPGAGTISLPGAKQIYRFEASPGQQIFVTTARYDSEMRQIKLRLLDSLGDEVESTCLGCGNMGAVTLRKGGSYTLVVSSDTDPATGTYEIRIEPVQ
ncbi:MAG: hypothetical protein HGB28_00405, partial [Oscillochloris sp.]|nr:hypothetical protein [Oscillochloris sp.]